jgi:regulator of RNase E activity RraA
LRAFAACCTLVASLLSQTGLLAQHADSVGAKPVADAAERLTGHRAHMSDDIRLLAGTRLSGPALTLRFVRDDNASGTEVGLVVVKLLETAPSGSVVLAVLEGDKSFAVFGATFATLARARHLGGFIVDGAVRDVRELRRLGFPMFARGSVAGSAGGHYRLEGVNVPVVCGGLEVNAGDLIVADEDGVAVAPQQQSREILTAASRLQREEKALLPLIAKHGSYLRAVQELNGAKPKP